MTFSALRLVATITFAVVATLPDVAAPHGGGLNAEGCHNNRKTGDYHCHRAPAGGSTRKAPPSATGFVDPNQGRGGSDPRNAAGETERRLEELKRLHGRGLVTDQEYERKRAEILKGL